MLSIVPTSYARGPHTPTGSPTGSGRALSPPSQRATPTGVPTFADAAVTSPSSHGAWTPPLSPNNREGRRGQRPRPYVEVLNEVPGVAAVTTAVTTAAVVRAGERGKVGIRSSPGLPPVNGAAVGSVGNPSTGAASRPVWSTAVDCARPPPSPRLPLPVVAAADGRDRLFPPRLVNIATPVAATSRHATTRRSSSPEQARHPDPRGHQPQLPSAPVAAPE